MSEGKVYGNELIKSNKIYSHKNIDYNINFDLNINEFNIPTKSLRLYSPQNRHKISVKNPNLSNKNKPTSNPKKYTTTSNNNNNQFLNLEFLNELDSSTTSQYDDWQKSKKPFTLYDKAKLSMLRKKNNIEKKKAKEEEKIKSFPRTPKMDKNSEKIVKSLSWYIPIQQRADSIHKNHIFDSLINNRKNKLKKMEEENKEYEMMKKYTKKKKFNEYDWEKFIKSQEFWNKERMYKIKAAEVLKYKMQEKMRNAPEISSKSKKIVSKLKKKNLYINDTHLRLYNNFDELQERKKMRFCNSMPSFKPIINSNYKEVKKKKSKNIPKKPLKIYISKNYNEFKVVHTHFPTKSTTKSYINSSSNLQKSSSQFLFNSYILKSSSNINNKNKNNKKEKMISFNDCFWQNFMNCCII